MIGAASITRSSAPTSTGNVPSLVHPATARAASSPGSSEETNAPSSTARSTCTAIRARPNACSRRRSSVGASVALATDTVTFTRAPGPSAHSAATRTTSSIGSRRRTSRPATTAPRPTSSSHSSPPASTTRSSCCAAASGNSGSGGRSISRSTASSHGTQVTPSTSSSETGTRSRPSRPHRTASTARCCTCSPRTRTANRVALPGSTTHSVRHSQRSEPSASANARGNRTPHCQRTWFFGADAR